MTFDTPKLLGSCILRDFVKEDAEPLADIEYDPIIKRYVGKGVIATPRGDWEHKVSRDPGSLRGWAIEVIPEHVLAGRASLSKVKNAPLGTIELEIVVAKPFWGRRLGRQVATALIQSNIEAQ
jgi:RimJ/RimL family protein N-acetyltransferase